MGTMAASDGLREFLSSLETRLMLSGGAPQSVFSPQGEEVAPASLAGLGSVSGTLWEDRNANGLRDAGEGGLAGRTVYADLNGNGMLDWGAPQTFTFMPEDTPQETLGGYGLSSVIGMGVLPNVYRTLDIDVSIRASSELGSFDLWDTIRADLTSVDGRSINLFDILIDTDFSLYLDITLSDEAAEYIHPGDHQGDLSGSYIPNESLANLEGTAMQGDWTLTLTQELDPYSQRLMTLSDWSITVVLQEPTEPQAVTDADGAYTLDYLTPGSVQVRQILPDGWAGTGATGYGQTVQAVSGQNVTGVSFGSSVAGTVSGILWEDRNANGFHDAGEGGLAGRTVYADLNGNGTLDWTAEKMTFTANDLPLQTYDSSLGSVIGVGPLPPVYRLLDFYVSVQGSSELGSGDYGFWDMIGANLTGPDGRSTNLFDRMVMDDYSSVYLDILFSDDAPGRFQDSGGSDIGGNQSGWYAPNESLAKLEGPAMQGDWTLSLTQLLDPGVERLLTLSGWSITLAIEVPAEPQAVTDASGAYTLEDVTPGSVPVRQILPAGWNGTGFAGNGQTVQVAPGQTAAGVSFGSSTAGTIGGTVWDDRNGDGQQIGEPGLPGWIVYADRNGNGQLDQTLLTPTSTGGPWTIPAVGGTGSAITVAGATSLVQDVNITLNITHPIISELWICLVSPRGTSVLLFNGLNSSEWWGGSLENFTNTTVDDAGASFGDGMAPYTGSYRPVNSLSAFSGEDPTGVWRLEVFDMEGDAGGTLDNWSLALTLAEPAAVTDGTGQYLLHGVPAGLARVRTAEQPNWQPTVPSGGYRDISLGSGQMMAGVSFGQADQATQGRLGGDANGDGAVDVGDLGIMGFNYGKTSGMTWANGDFTGDGAVDVGDLGVLGANYGRSVVAATMVAPAAMATGRPEAFGRRPAESAAVTMPRAGEQAGPILPSLVDRDIVQARPLPAETEATIQQAWLAPLATGSAFGVVEHRDLSGVRDATPDVLELALLGLPL